MRVVFICIFLGNSENMSTGLGGSSISTGEPVITDINRIKSAEQQ